MAEYEGKVGGVIWLDEDEKIFVNGWLLSLEPTEAGVSVNYMFVRDFCQKHHLDAVDIFGLWKKMALYAKKGE